ncbi:glycosyltransferase [Litoribacter alkaliphilus]|uniref:Glycosyltransferase n=1 Tax=Litoribacter ruber TaxID=702568 RepID=A0AAP2CGI6_9BACT|nr:glycosyltransferase family 2 protein [Litoribacter alkaliphilus]MBS9523194.1 glycosyltransferase [Litoribacter alkaliphilus]
MKISVVTVSFNSIRTIKDTINSVLAQDYHDLEYIVIDGNSWDGTVEILKSIDDPRLKWISEPDKGIYDGMNKGIKMASGEIVGILNSDDFYKDETVVSQIAKEFSNSNAEAVFGDVSFVNPKKLNKTVRYYSSKFFNPSKFRYGFMPAHPTFFTRKIWFEEFGYYQTDYKIAADYELLTRFLYKHKLPYRYVPVDMVVMRTGGVSNRSIVSNYILNKEIIRGCKENGIRTYLGLLMFKYFVKVFELVPKWKVS